ncbi:hypothetical protein CAQUA_07035 [Corynebacterium aquatimens]|uniref:Uncharacterized protein n=1 Tax=Corynebacterium aquatimens TaxID=1190508 RepID=A0A931GQY6_9CORY|nr:hypothetical protein [Corynebacterium aquatimens]WJY66105.1 hypothetical protein CAQUA_07035 [Corynebacterium aquatimens]
MSENEVLFPGVPISDSERESWDRETRKLREAWEVGRERFSEASQCSPRTPFRPAFTGGAFV